MNNKRIKLLWVLFLAVTIEGCGTNRIDLDSYIDTSVLEAHKAAIRDAIPKREPLCQACNNPYQIDGRRYFPLSTAAGYQKRGIASWYGPKFHGKTTSNGEIYNMYEMTAAHKTLPLPTYVSVTNVNNGKKVVVRINDRGPFVDDRIIDLSYAAALKLDVVKHGTAPVVVKAVAPLGYGFDAISDQKYYLAVGSFRNRNNANNFVGRLKTTGFDNAHINEKSVSGAIFHQVRIGPFKNRNEVEIVIDTVKARMRVEPIVISE